MDGKFVAYYRVSTDRQGKSGLGLEAQKAAVLQYLNGGNWSLLAEFVEVESGKVNDRPQLAAAMERCRLTGATLVIAKLDRLSRNAAFLLSIRDAGVDFVCADMPDANRMTVGVMALVAEHEREAISERTKAALAAAKARGKALGGFRGGPVVDHTRGHAAQSAAAEAFAARVLPVIRQIQAGGTATLLGIAAELTQQGIATPRGGVWTADAVRRVMLRAV
jgi:DNA invertase Pin-like site-specific DNA recombinase